MDKSLFIQELLISSIENFFKHDLKFERSREDRIGLEQQSGLDEARSRLEVRLDGVDDKPDLGKSKTNETGETNAESKIDKEQPINGEAVSPNNQPATDGPENDRVANESQRINESNQSNHQSSNNQELNNLESNQIAKADGHPDNGVANSEPAASNSVDSGADNAASSSNVSTLGNPPGNDPVARIKSEQSNEPRSDEPPAK